MEQSTILQTRAKFAPGEVTAKHFWRSVIQWSLVPNKICPESTPNTYLRDYCCALFLEVNPTAWTCSSCSYKGYITEVWKGLTHGLNVEERNQVPGCLKYCHKFYKSRWQAVFRYEKGMWSCKQETRIPKHDLGDAYCYCGLMLINGKKLQTLLSPVNGKIVRSVKQKKVIFII